MKFNKNQTREIIRLNIILNRKKLNITQSELGDMVGLKKTTVASWEQGLCSPTIETLIELLDIFNMDFYEFTGLEAPNKELQR